MVQALSEYELIAKKLRNRTPVSITASDVEEWYEDGNDNVDGVVRRLMGDHAYDRLDRCARMSSGLNYLLGIGPRKVGGVDLEIVINGY